MTYKFVTGDKDHDMIQGGAILPDALRWLWRDYPQPIAKPAMHHLGDRQTGFVDVGTDWEMVATLGQVPTARMAGILVADSSESLRDCRELRWISRETCSPAILLERPFIGSMWMGTFQPL